MSGPSSSRPRLRGVSHRIAFFIALGAGAWLVAVSHDRVTTAIYATLLAAMFGVSATLHRGGWSPQVFGWLRRADHAMIFACIAGSYTPFCVLGMPPASGNRLLALSWIAAGLGMLRALLWPHAPRLVSSTLYVAAGWVLLAYLPQARAALDPSTFALMIAGGAWFTVGAFVYLTRWPDPWPAVFGFHEVFHLMIIAGCTCHFIAIARLAA